MPDPLTITVTLTMTPDTARSVLNIIQHAIAEGDSNLEEKPGEYDRSTVEFHEHTKDSLQRQVLTPLLNCFPPNKLPPDDSPHPETPEDLIGHQVRIMDDEAPHEGKVVRLDEYNKAEVIVLNGKVEWKVHWLLCRIVD